MEINKMTIVKALASVLDPNTGQDLITANMVTGLQVEGNNIQFTLELPSLNNEYKQKLNFACQEVILAAYPDANIHIHMSGRDGVSPQPGETKAPVSPLPHVKNIIAVASGKGGVGKSTVATNLALALKALGSNVGLLDADLYGPSIPTMLGLKGQRPKIREIHGLNKIVPLEAHGIHTLSIGFIIEPEQAVVLRGPRLGAVLKQFIQDTVWPPLDYLIIDLPPGTGDVQLTLVQTVPLTGAVMVTTPQDVAFDDAIKAMNMFLLPNINVPILGVVENMSWFTPAELPDNKYYIFGQGGGTQLAKVSESKLLGQIPIVQSIREAGDSGKPAVLNEKDPLTQQAFLSMAKNVVQQVTFRNANMAPTQKVEMEK